jgi:hypothetical protein
MILKNVLTFPLFIPNSVPLKNEKTSLAFENSEPTKAICSTLIAQAFQSVLYPILIITHEDNT